MATPQASTPTPSPAGTPLYDAFELRRVLVAELRGAGQAARDAIGVLVRDPEAAVHQFRKALRRARAVLALVRDALPREERRAARLALRQARRALGSVRDHAVAPEALASLQLGEAERAAADAVLAAAVHAMPARDEIERLLAEGAARAAAEVEILEAALPQGIEWTTVLDGLRRTYRDARRARRAAKRSKRSFHAWRRRTKELALQLQLLTGHAGPRIDELEHAVAEVAGAQGEIVDLIMLRSYVRTHGEGIPEDVRAQLVDAIDVQLAPRMKEARRGAKQAFRRPAGDLGRRLGKGLEGDHSPVA
jgi:CHAD domain-containing protein